MGMCKGCKEVFNTNDMIDGYCKECLGKPNNEASIESKESKYQSINTNQNNIEKKSNKKIIIISSLIIFFVLFYTQITIFVIPPIGMVPEGKTLIISRLNKTEFIDSADAMCVRENGGVSLLCRLMMLGAVINKSTIYARLPYSQTLYDISNQGRKYEM